MVAGLRNPESEPFRNAVAGLGAYPSFALVAIAASTADGACHDIYVHSKIALIDDAWCTIGSTNIANRSFHGDTELNASFWHAQTVRTLRRELLLEHTGVDTADLDDQAALRLYATRARENTARRARGEPLQGLAFALDPATYAR
jgi:phosphatidylserine/phosphatidylglycerophosphate/cardiolipin synthase-like enzyme